MNIRRIAEKTRDFLNSDERKRKEKKAFLKHVIKKLKKHEKALGEKLEDENDAAERAKIESEIALVHAQRKKGLLKLSELKKSRKKG
jgi:hypothetical protein